MQLSRAMRRSCVVKQRKPQGSIATCVVYKQRSFASVISAVSSTAMTCYLTILLLVMCAQGCWGNIMWFFEDRDSKVEPVDNIETAMQGYDCIMSDPTLTPDPGIRKQLFDPLYMDGGRTYLKSFVDNVKRVEKCDEDFTVTPVESMASFLDEKNKGYTFFLDILTDETLSNIPDLKLLSEKQQPKEGQILFGRANCVVAEVNIAPFEKPAFTKKFQNAIRAFHHASLNPRSLRSKKTAIAFFRTYGTHFMISTKLGSKILFWKEFAKGAGSGDDARSFETCVLTAARETITDSSGNASVSAKMFQSKASMCKDPKAGSLESFLKDSSIPAETMIVNGELPQSSMQKWIKDVHQAPVPVYFELMKINYFFRHDWLDFMNDTVGDMTKDAETMYDYFEVSLLDYCTRLQGTHCSDHHFTDTLAVAKAESNEDNRVSRAVSPPKSGTIVISGGFEDMHSALSSVEVLGDRSLYIGPLPYEMGGHSLTSIGPVLYNCGGSTPWDDNAAEHKRSCFMLNITQKHPVWSSAFQLPSSIKNFHTVVSVGTRLWYFNKGSKVVSVFDSVLGVFFEYKLPFTVTNKICVSKFNSSIISVDTDSGVFHVLNDTSQPDEWSNFSHIIQTRVAPVCLTVDRKLYITGDGHANRTSNFEVYDPQYNSVTLIHTFVHPRSGYLMFVWKGAPAAAGGLHPILNTMLDSVERYNTSSKQWQVLLECQLQHRRVWYGLTQITYTEE